MWYWTSPHAVYWDLGSAVMCVSYIAPAIMYVTTEPNWQVCWVLLHWISGHVCSSYIRPVCMYVLLSPDQLPRHHCYRVKQTYLPLRMFEYVALDRHTYLKPSSYVCNSFARLAGMLQYPCFKPCFEPTGSCTQPHVTSVIIKLDQHACLLELHLPADVFYSCTWLAAMSL